MVFLQLCGIPHLSRNLHDLQSNGVCSGCPTAMIFYMLRCLQVRDEKDPELLVLSTDRCLFEDEGFR
jgi:hypothetical protein